MLVTILIYVLLIFWLFGIFGAYALGSSFHLLLIAAFAIRIGQIIKGVKPL